MKKKSESGQSLIVEAAAQLSGGYNSQVRLRFC